MGEPRPDLHAEIQRLTDENRALRAALAGYVCGCGKSDCPKIAEALRAGAP